MTWFGLGRSARHWPGTRVVLTGASSGIGHALALQLGARGARLLITARRADRLASLEQNLRVAGVEVQSVVGDITDAAVQKTLMELATARWGAVDLLINNAGVGARGPFLVADPDRLRRTMEVNFFAVAELIRLSVPLLRQGQRPRIVNISSVLGHRAVRDRSEYCASKFALHGFSDALRAELAHERIGVTIVSPSSTATEFTDNLLENLAPKKSYGQPMSAEAVARCTLRAIEREVDESILSWGGRLLVWLDRCSPPLANWLVARFG